MIFKQALVVPPFLCLDYEVTASLHLSFLCGMQNQTLAYRVRCRLVKVHSYLQTDCGLNSGECVVTKWWSYDTTMAL
jgi:hypothetical protein